MTTSVQMCGFEASQLADLRADFGVFADTKYRELPGASGAPAFPICGGCKLVRYCVSNLFRSILESSLTSDSASLRRTSTKTPWKRACPLRDGFVRFHSEARDVVLSGRLPPTAHLDTVCRDGVLHSWSSVQVRCEEDIHAHRPVTSSKRRWEPRKNFHHQLCLLRWLTEYEPYR